MILRILHHKSHAQTKGKKKTACLDVKNDHAVSFACLYSIFGPKLHFLEEWRKKMAKRMVSEIHGPGFSSGDRGAL